LHGVLIAAGGPFRQGVHLEELSITDVAPTVLHLLGASVPRDMDGRVLVPTLDQDWLTVHPIQMDEPRVQRPDIVRRDYTNEEAADIEERLRGMGYIE
jgi:arylsulfatase A-like enzyme